MKNKILILILLVSGAIIMTSCEDEDAVRIPETSDGVNLRIQQHPDFVNMRADDIENAKLVFSLFSENKNLQEVSLTIEYYNFAEDKVYARKPLRTYSQADFDAADGAIRDVTVTSQELATLFEIQVSDIGGGDRYDVFNLTTLTDGRIFPDTLNLPGGVIAPNLTPNIANSAATTSFSVGFRSYVACPVPAGYATGDYLLEQIAGPDDPFFGNPTRFTSEVVNLTATSPIQRNFEVTYLTFDERRMSFLLICGSFLVNQKPGLGCSSDLRWTNATPPGSYDVSDDSVLIVELLENVDGDCGIPAGEPLTLRLTKQ